MYNVDYQYLRPKKGAALNAIQIAEWLLAHK